jgi:hypothetical protein
LADLVVREERRAWTQYTPSPARSLAVLQQHTGQLLGTVNMRAKMTTIVTIRSSVDLTEITDITDLP